MRVSIYSIVVVLTLLLFTNCGNRKCGSSQQLIVFHAGSLSIPFKQIKDKFEEENPGVEVLLEAAGSVRCARKIIDLNKPCDIMASADYSVIDEMLIPEYSQWNIKFASNEMCIVFHEESRYANEINFVNWYRILQEEGVAYGRSDPNSDPCGYRAVLTLQLAEKYYKEESLTEKMLAKDNEFIRPKETDLLALLESNTIDYVFLYRSVAEQHGLKYIVLPDSINLKNPNADFGEFYKQSSIEIAGKKPGEHITKKGQPMVYGITVLSGAPNKKLALKFVDFVLSKKGMAIMEANGQPSLLPAVSDSYNKIPEPLKKYAKEE